MTETLRIEYRQVETLIPFARNPRTHSEAQVAKIAASIVEYGWTNPLLVDGDNGLIAGHGRLAAARKLGLAEVPVIELGHLSPTQKRAYVIGDNQLALQAGWDEELLALELAELQDAGYDLALSRDRPRVRGRGHPSLPPELPRCAGDAPGQWTGIRCCRGRAPGRASMSISWLADKIEQWPTDKLLPYARNARTHSEAQVAQIAASIAEFGFTNPILAGGDGVIVAGHGRLSAAQKLGLPTVPVVVLDHLTPTQRRALVIADNRIAENAGWDEAMLQVELAALQDDNFDLALTGFDADSLADLLAGEETTTEGQTDDDAAPEVPETPVSKSGDIWICGDHRVLCGDATDADAYATLLGDEMADMVWQDPPYNVNYANTPKDRMRGKDRAILNDNLGDGFQDFLLAALTPALAHCQGAVYVAMSSSELDTLQSAFRAAGGKWSTFIIWAKNTFTLGHADYQRQFEPILYGWPEGSKHYWCGDRDQGDVWQIRKPAKNDLHPTMKPVELVERAIRNSSRPGDVVLDAFGGSGTTLIAAEKSGRRARLIELDPKYCDVIVRRWQQWTGKEATRASDGAGFNALPADPPSPGDPRPR